MTNSIEEIRTTDCLFVIGSNTTENHPIISLSMIAAVKERGAKLIVADPRAIELTNYATVFLQQRPGTDVALINGFINYILSENLQDGEFIQNRTEGFEELKESVKEYDLKTVERITGVPPEALKKAARIYATSPTSAIFYAMGITQHVAGTDCVKALANLAMVCGKVGKENCGINPLRGQNNVQGACDMGALPPVFSGYQSVADETVRAKFENTWKVKLSDKPGLTLVEMMNAIEEGKIKALYVMGEDPLLTDPNLKHIREAMRQIEFLIVQDIFLSETGKYADVVLPGVSFAEKDGTFTNTERRVQRVRKAIEPPGEAKADWQIICELSVRMGYPMTYREPSEIMDEITRLTPSYGGIMYDRLEGNGIQWPCPNKEHPGTRFLHRDKFTRGLGKFHPVKYQDSPELPDKEYPFILTTGRVLYHYHSGNMSRHSLHLNEYYPEGSIEINPFDARKLGCKDGDLLEVKSRRGEMHVKAKVTDRSPAGVVFATFHFREAAVNLLTIDKLDPIAKIPEYKVCAVSIKKFS